MEKQEKKEIEYLEEAFTALLTSDKFFTLIMMGKEKKTPWSTVLKIAHDRSADYNRRQEYWNLHRYAELLGI